MKINGKIYKKANTNKWTLNYIDPIENKRIRKSFLTKKAAAIYLKELSPNLIRSKKIRDNSKQSKTDSKQTINSIIKEYLTLYPESNFMTVKYHTRLFTDKFGTTEPQKITPTLLRDWLIKIRVQHNLSLHTLGNLKAQVQILFQYMKRENYIAANPFKKIKLRGRVDIYRRNKLSQNDMKKILENLSYFSPYFLYRFIFSMYRTGITMTELINLKRQHFNYDDRRINIVSPEAGFVRSIIIPADVADMLNELPKRIEYLMCNRYGRKIDPNNIHRQIVHLKKCYPKTPPFNTSHIRNATAFHFLENGGSFQELSRMLGHPSLDTTVRLYGKPRKIFWSGEAASEEEISSAHWGIQILD